VDLSGQSQLEAPRGAVWDLLTDIRRLADCGPGSAGLQILDDRHARIQTRLGGGLMATGLTLDLALDESAPPDRLTLTARGQAAGTRIDGSAVILLSGPEAGPTTLDWRATLRLAGSFAGIGERMLEGTARPAVERALDCLRTQLARPAGA